MNSLFVSLKLAPSPASGTWVAFGHSVQTSLLLDWISEDANIMTTRYVVQNWILEENALLLLLY